MPSPKKLVLLGVPSGLGGNTFGCQEGPAAIRKILLPQLKKRKIIPRDLGDISPPVTCFITDPRAKCIGEIRQTDNLLIKKIRREKVFERAMKGQKSVLPVLLGGDHSLNYSFILEAKRRLGKIGLIWFDAHADYNTPETTPSGNVHGMVLAGLARKIEQRNICIFGLRDTDPEEKIRLEKSRITVITIEEIRRRGVEKSLQKAVKAVSKNANGIHLSFDLDVFDPTIAPGTGTPVKKGLNSGDLRIIMDTLKNCGKAKTCRAPIISADIMELNPLKDKYEKTARLAAEIILGLL